MPDFGSLSVSQILAHTENVEQKQGEYENMPGLFSRCSFIICWCCVAGWHTLEGSITNESLVFVFVCVAISLQLYCLVLFFFVSILLLSFFSSISHRARFQIAPFASSFHSYSHAMLGNGISYHQNRICFYWNLKRYRWKLLCAQAMQKYTAAEIFVFRLYINSIENRNQYTQRL